MTYHIHIKKSKVKDFIQIIESLKNLGVIESYDSHENLVKEGEVISTKRLLKVLEVSKKQVEEKKTISSKQVQSLIQSWKQKQ